MIEQLGAKRSRSIGVGMWRTMSASFAALLAFGSALGAQSAEKPDFTPIAWLAGSCWVAHFPDGKSTDTHCFEWQYDKQFLRDRHVVSSTPPYEGETLYSWNAAAKRIDFRYWSNAGFVLDGSVEQNGNTIVFPGRLANTDGSVTELKAVWTRVDANTYTVAQSQKSGTGWVEGLKARYERR